MEERIKQNKKKLREKKMKSGEQKQQKMHKE